MTATVSQYRLLGGTAEAVVFPKRSQDGF